MKELTITKEDIELLKEMKNNCLNLSVYDDEKRLLKANAITKFLVEHEENQQLKEELNKYTDPKDLTLMFMYCDEKAKDKIKCLEQENQQLKEELKQKEDIIDKVIKWIENDYYSMNTTDIDTILVTNNKLLQIRKFLKGDK